VGLRLHERSDLAVKLILRTVDVEVHRRRDALGENLLRLPGPVRLALREIDHRLLHPAKVEGGASALHRLADGLHVGVGVLVQKLEEQAEVDGVALVRCGGEEQEGVYEIKVGATGCARLANSKPSDRLSVK
jgi:hypothetical protein